MTLNLDEADINISVSAECDWTPLQADICMSVAVAKRDAFICESRRLADLVRLKVLPRAVAADYLHEAAVYNSLFFEYGCDHIQEIMAVAFEGGAASS
jgi:hypothetical protein